MEYKTPGPEAVGGGNCVEIEIVIKEWVEPVDAADEGIQNKMQHDVGEDDGGDDGSGAVFRNERTDHDKAPEGEPEQGQMGPVVVVKSLFIVDEIEVE